MVYPSVMAVMAMAKLQHEAESAMDSVQSPQERRRSVGNTWEHLEKSNGLCWFITVYHALSRFITVYHCVPFLKLG